MSAKATCRRIVALGVLFGVITVPVARAGEAAAGKYNVLLLIVDDLDASLVSALNARSPVRTPNMQRIASHGTWFTRAYSVVPLCGPSRAALLSGVHAANSGVYFNDQPPRRSSGPISRAQGGNDREVER